MSRPQSENPVAARSAGWPDYAARWRWHFYAGLFCIPFVVVLSITGTIYLFRPQIEAWQQRPYDRLANHGDAKLPLSQQIQAAVASVNAGKFITVEQPRGSTQTDEFISATRVIVDQGGRQVRVFVDPRVHDENGHDENGRDVVGRNESDRHESGVGNVIGSAVEDEQFIRVVRRIHGELLLGNRGSYLVELAASWTIQSETANRPHQQSIRYDPVSRSVVDRETFADRHWLDQIVGQGIALHEGQRFGLLNQLIACVCQDRTVGDLDGAKVARQRFGFCGDDRVIDVGMLGRCPTGYGGNPGHFEQRGCSIESNAGQCI